MRSRKILLWGGAAAIVLAALVDWAQAQPRTPAPRTWPGLPIREVTVFKDGHAFVVHEGPSPTTPEGHVILDGLPQPVLGTFWAHSATPDARLVSVLASREPVDANVPAKGLLDLVQANVGKRVRVQEVDQTKPYEAILDHPLSEGPDSIVLLRLAKNTKTLALSRIQSLVFLDCPERTLPRPQPKDTMEFHLDWGPHVVPDTALVGLSYVQRGIRWIPGYRIETDGQGKAKVELQATLINELADLQDTTVHMVVGVPRFAFEDTPDPISFQQAAALLSAHMRPDARTAYALSNAITTQVALPGAVASGPYVETGSPMDLGPDLKASTQHEDLFLFTMEHVTMRKGQRLVFPLAQFDLYYTDVYTLNIPCAPPTEFRRDLNTDQQLQLARLFHRPKVMHVLRVENTSECPLTTAPVLLLKNGRVLAQSMVTYTAIGGTCDIEVTQAVDIAVKVNDRQISVTPNAVAWDGHQYTKVQMAGSLQLVNRTNKPVRIEATRSILGTVEQATPDGCITQHPGGDLTWLLDDGLPLWWNWRSWPWWWYHFNGFSRVRWDVELAPSKTMSLDASWHYFWLP